MQIAPFQEAESEQVWHNKYQWSEHGRAQERSIEATWDRVALAVSSAEAHHRHAWRERFRALLSDFRFLPSGRILAGAGTSRRSTLVNCFAAGPIEDSIAGIFAALRDSMVTLQAGCGLGIDFSTLRPAGAAAVSSGGVASGPVSYLPIWEKAIDVLEAGKPRHCTLMATLRCDHPDVEAFIDAKMDAATLAHFNLSVLVTDEFLRALEQDDAWPLVFPLGGHVVPVDGELCTRVWPGSGAAQQCLVHRRVPARALWKKLLLAQQAVAQLGILFIDPANRANNLWYCECLSTVSPWGEVPMPPHGCCNLGSINLTRFVRQPFSARATVDFADLKAVAALATRFLDDIYDISLFPLKAQEKAARASRSVGLGVTGLADMFAMLGLRYGSDSSIALTRKIMCAVRDSAYRASTEIAHEKGPFPAFDKVRYGASAFVRDLPADIQNEISQHGIRNSHLLAVAPAGSISLLANNVSSGIAPPHAGRSGHPADDSTGHVARGMEASTGEQLQLMATVQACVDNAVSRTLHVPAGTSVEALELDLLRARDLGLKGFAAHSRGAARLPH